LQKKINYDVSGIRFTIGDLLNAKYAQEARAKEEKSKQMSLSVWVGRR
jgi:hypothetical protein